MNRSTVADIEGKAFLIGAEPTYAGRSQEGMKIEGLLMNSRMVQGIFDDLNPDTRPRWDYPDGPWDAERNTDEFVAAMPAWREHGLLSFTINLQGGNPVPYSRDQPWHNSAFRADGSLRDDYLARLARVLDRADELRMAPIVGLFYFGQDHRLADEAAVARAADAAADWIIDSGYRNVLIEVANEVDHPKYTHAILKADRCHEMVRHIQRRSEGRVDSPRGRLLVGASMCGGRIPPEGLVGASDFLLLHGNGVSGPDGIRRMADGCRELPAYRGQPIVFNEDDHFEFDAPDNNMMAAISRYCSWGYFDWRMPDEGFDDGYQSVPVNWGISSPRKRAFFGLLKQVTGA